MTKHFKTHLNSGSVHQRIKGEKSKYFKLSKIDDWKTTKTVHGGNVQHGPPTQGRIGKFQTAVSFYLRKWKRNKLNPV